MENPLDETSKKSDIDQKENNTKESNDDFQIGQVLWSKLGKYPYWPSIVSLDSKTNEFVKGKPEEKEFSIHVQFCNDSGRHSWLKNVELYLGKNEFLAKYPNGLSFFKNNKKAIMSWNLAVEEADSLLAYDREERIKIFYEKYNLTLPSVSTPNTPIDEKDIVDGKLFNSFVYLKDCNVKVVKPKRKYTKKLKNPINTMLGIEDSYNADKEYCILPEEPEITTTKLHRLVPSERKKQIRNAELEIIKKQKNIN